MILKNALSFIIEFLINSLDQIRKIYFHSSYYDKRISKNSNLNLIYKPSPHLLSSLINYQKKKST